MNTTEKKQSLLDTLYEPYKKCLECPLGSQGRQKIVFGDGNPDAKIMFIGEAPGKQEDATGIPFVGRAGQLLNRIFTLVGIERNDIFITNIVKCRPPKNRKPTPLENNRCKKILLINQIKIIDPVIICTLGATALEGLYEKEIKISQVRGNPLIIDGKTIIPTFHPAYILRNPKELEKMISDIEKVFSYTTNTKK